MRKFRVRIKTCFDILFGKHQSWVLIKLEKKKDLVDLLEGKDIHVETTFEGLQKYNMLTLIKRIGDSLDMDELILEKAKFEGEAEIYNIK